MAPLEENAASGGRMIFKVPNTFGIASVHLEFDDEPGRGR